MNERKLTTSEVERIRMDAIREHNARMHSYRQIARIFLYALGSLVIALMFLKAFSAMIEIGAPGSKDLSFFDLFSRSKLQPTNFHGDEGESLESANEDEEGDAEESKPQPESSGPLHLIDVHPDVFNKSAQAFAVDEKTGRVFVAGYESNEIYVVDLENAAQPPHKWTVEGIVRSLRWSEFEGKAQLAVLTQSPREILLLSGQSGSLQQRIRINVEVDAFVPTKELVPLEQHRWITLAGAKHLARLDLKETRISEPVQLTDGYSSQVLEHVMMDYDGETILTRGLGHRSRIRWPRDSMDAKEAQVNAPEPMWSNSLRKPELSPSGQTVYVTRGFVESGLADTPWPMTAVEFRATTQRVTAVSRNKNTMIDDCTFPYHWFGHPTDLTTRRPIPSKREVQGCQLVGKDLWTFARPSKTN